MFRVHCFATITEQTTKYWLNGNCTKMPKQDICALCFMHQYGLHLTKDNLSEICAGKVEPDPEITMKRCYWDPFAIVPFNMRNHSLAHPLFDEDILWGEYCPPDDVEFKSTPLQNDYVSYDYFRNNYEYFDESVKTASTKKGSAKSNEENLQDREEYDREETNNYNMLGDSSKVTSDGFRALVRYDLYFLICSLIFIILSKF